MLELLRRIEGAYEANVFCSHNCEILAILKKGLQILLRNDLDYLLAACLVRISEKRGSIAAAEVGALPFYYSDQHPKAT